MPGPMMPRRDPMLDMAALRDAMQSGPQLGPVYPAWLGDIKKPDSMKMAELATRKFDEYSEWRKAIRHDLRMIRMQESGIFPDDAPDVKSGIMETYESHGLVDEYNLAVSWFSGMQRRVVKVASSDETKDEARKVKLACELLLEYEAECHTDKGEMPSRILEPKVLLGYGVIAKRRVLDRFAEPYDSPFITRYIDPAQLVPESDDRGLKRMFRVYSAKIADIANTYGDFSPSVRKKLENKYGKFDDDLEISNIVEYWDRWWRCVTCEGGDILPMTEHKYGEVPYTIGYGPLGEPNMTMLPDESGSPQSANESWRENMPYKCVPFVRYIKRSHIMHEALMSRYLYGVKLELWPPEIRERDWAAANKPAKPLDASPGAVNELIMGSEESKPFPFPSNSNMNRQLLLDALNRDMTTGRAPMSAYGHMDQSNISGTANKQSAQAGLQWWKPWANALESFNGRDLSKAMRIWQRLGNVIEYGQQNRRPFTVPIAKPYRGESSSFELKRETINTVGARVKVTMSSVNPEDWLLRSQAMEVMNKQGFAIPYLADHLLGIDYDPQMFEEWQEEKAIKLAMEHPKFLELEVIPAMLLNEIAEADGDEAQQTLLVKLAQRWDELVVQPAMLEHQMKMGQMMAQPQPSEGQGGMSQQAQPGGMPPTTSGVSLPERGQGPGSVTGRQGGPQGPLGPRTGA